MIADEAHRIKVGGKLCCGLWLSVYQPSSCWIYLKKLNNIFAFRSFFNTEMVHVDEILPCGRQDSIYNAHSVLPWLHMTIRAWELVATVLIYLFQNTPDSTGELFERLKSVCIIVHSLTHWHSDRIDKKKQRSESKIDDEFDPEKKLDVTGIPCQTSVCSWWCLVSGPSLSGRK